MENPFEAVEPKRENLPAQLPTTMKQIHFAKAYVECGDVLEAARRAGYRGNDYSLRVIGTRLLNQEDVRGLIRRHLKSVITPEEVASIISDIARGSVEHFLARDEHGNIKTNEEGQIQFDFSTLEAQTNFHLIKSIKNTRYGPSIELHDKLAALALIAKIVKVEDQKAMARRMMESVLDALPPELRGKVISHMNREVSNDVIEGSEISEERSEKHLPSMQWLEDMKNASVPEFESELGSEQLNDNEYEDTQDKGIGNERY